MLESSLLRKLRELLFRLWRSTRKRVATGRLRRYRALLFQAYVLIALLAFSVLALFASILSASEVSYLEFDLEATLELQKNIPQWGGAILYAVSWPGYAFPSIPIIGLVAIFLALAGLRWEAASAVFAATVTWLINYLVKIAIRRPRPSADVVDVFNELTSYSFPSGHVMFYTAFFGFLLFLAFTLLKRSWRRTLMMTLLFALIALVGISRIYLGEHWASDVIGGYLLGSLSLILAIQFYREGKARIFPDQPVAPAEPADLETSKVDPHLTQLGDLKDAHDPDRPGTGPSSGGPAR